MILRKLKNNKKGMLLAEETLKIILALIAISFLIYFLTALYFSKVKGDKLKYAEEGLSRTDEIISGLAENQNSTQDFFNPIKWSLISFVEIERPNSCVGKDCICICSEVIEYGIKNKEYRQAKECSKDGACLVVENLKGFEAIKIDDKPTKVFFEKKDGEVLVSDES